jgi:hypothetical protein
MGSNQIKGGKPMKTFGTIWAVVLFLGSAALAQQSPGTLASLEFQTPKNGMVTQYENGRKQKAAWHKQQNDPHPLLVWEILSGPETGTYVVGREGQHWADFDKPPISDETNLAEYNKEIGQYVQSVVSRYYDFMPKVSQFTLNQAPTKYAEVVVYEVKMGHQSQFEAGISRINDAIHKANWPGGGAGWYRLVNGGPLGEYVLVIPHKNWADFDRPDVKPLWEMVRETLGQEESQSLLQTLDNSISGGLTEIIEFRQDLSYMPSR